MLCVGKSERDRKYNIAPLDSFSIIFSITGYKFFFILASSISLSVFCFWTYTPHKGTGLSNNDNVSFNVA